MSAAPDHAAAIVGIGAIMPDAPDAASFWANVRQGRYSISEVDSRRWDPALYYDPDAHAPEKTYSKIGGWVRDWEWNPLGWKLPIPPKVSDAMDDAHKWAVACTRMALADAGWPDRPLDLERTAVIIGNAISGEKQYLSALRIMFPEVARQLEQGESFAALPPDVRSAIESDLLARFNEWLPDITEDTMPGELGNCIAGRVANLFNLHGPNFTTDAACASALAAMDATVDGLLSHEFDVAITGGVDRNMGAHMFIKFCAIGALSPSGTRPYADGADGFVMGEGAALFVVKRLADAVRDGDRIYAVVRGVGGASDGKGKGITAPNPTGQRLAVERAWRSAGISPTECTMIEGHGTSTRVGDVVEVSSLMQAFSGSHLAPGSIALGSVKSNIGHLKAAAGAAGLLKTTLALHDRVLPPSINFERPNPNLDWTTSPFAVNTELRDWDVPDGQSRVAGVSAFGFGGTNFHVVMEEHMPDRPPRNGHRQSIAVPTRGEDRIPAEPMAKPPLRGALMLGADTEAALANELRAALAEARQGRHLDPVAPSAEALLAPERVAIDYADGADLTAKAEVSLRLMGTGGEAAWPALRARGIHRGSGPAGKVAFLYTGQGSQYANMLAELRRREPVVADLFDEADEIMLPLLEGRRLSGIIFADPEDPGAMERAEAELRRTEIQQPAVITVDMALTRLLGEYGVHPDLVMGHSLGEYGALVAAGALSFEDALEAVSARGREMASLEVEDPGAMAAVMAPLDEVIKLVDAADGYVVLANINSTHQVVLGGATEAVGRVVAELQAQGHTAIPLPVSHAFHTEIVAPASVPLRAMLKRLGLRTPQIPVVGNVTGELYPTDGENVQEDMLDLLGRQVASPVQFLKGLHTLYAEGARVFIEVGPKHALQGFASDVLGDGEIVSLASNHPKQGDIATFNQALCGLWAAGLGTGRRSAPAAVATLRTGATAQPRATSSPRPSADMRKARDGELESLFAEFLERGQALMGRRTEEGGRSEESVVITGASLGLPGAERLFDDRNMERLLNGEQGIDVIPGRLRKEMLDKHITRLVKAEDGGATFATIDRLEAVIKLAARAGSFDLAEEFGVDDERVTALGRDTQMAIAAGIDALRDAGIPLVLRYKTTTKGTQLPDRWSLPEELRDETGVIFASAFPGLEEMTGEVERYTKDRMRRERLAALESLHDRMLDHGGTDQVVLAEVERRIHDLHRQIEKEPYEFDRRFLFRVLSMGHSQLAELIGARGPNTQINSACASTTQAVALAEDWIRGGRCRRVLIVAADDATSDTMMGWIGAGFLATGAAATDEVVEEAALPFDRRRHGMIIGMGAAGIMVESAEATRERGMTPICDVMASVTANSAFHGTRLDVDHIGAVMDRLVSQAERRGLSRKELAAETMFVSHETYTPARGGSAGAEIHALRSVFGEAADRIVIANVKGYTGHPMGVGLEDVLAVKGLETGVVPAVPNFHEIDPELGELNLSHGGAYPIRYALRLAAGFGSQISMLLLRWTPVADGRRRNVDELGYEYRIADRERWTEWLRRVSGHASPHLEVIKRRLRVVDQAAAPETQAPAPTEPEPVVIAEPEPEPEPATQPATAETTPTTDGVEARVLALVAEQTGYPEDLLDMDLDLEADLGIDTVKQAEVFATLREAYGIEFDQTLKLRDYPTLNHVVGFIRDRMPQAEIQAETTPATDDVEARVLALVAEQTGYPEDLLDMDLDLEADLGIDTVKQAEVFATLREAYGIEFDQTLKLRDYPTLNHVVGFIRDRMPQTPAPAAISEDPRFPRRVPVPVLRPDLELCVPTGVTLDSARVIVMPDAGGVGGALADHLGRLGAEALMIEGTPDVAALERQIAEWVSAGEIRGVYWLPALDDEGPLSELDAEARHSALHVRVKLLAATMRALPAEAFLVAGSRLGGRHGYDAGGAASVLGGAVTGFTKALAREREETLVKAVDVATDAAAEQVAELLIQETLRDPGAVEIGHADELRWTIAMIDQPAETDPEREPSSDTVFLVTGAAGSIVSAITQQLASAASGGTFHLFDLVPKPDPDDPDMARFSNDREGLKRDLADRIRDRGERPTPKLIEQELARIERGCAALDAWRAIERAGGNPHWHQVDLLDAAGVSDAVGRAVSDRPIDVLLHCAGVEISHFLPDKPQHEYDLVFDVKAHGWLNVLSALQEAGAPPPRTAIAFSSIAGRFGNAGQTDYAAANDLLCKSISNMRSEGRTRGIAIDWTAWSSIGMASRGSIPKMMELAGIDMLPPDAGVPVVWRELATAGQGGEIIEAGALGVLLSERHLTGGLDGNAASAKLVQRSGPMTGRIEKFGADGTVTVVTELDPTRQPFLNDHRIDGTPVLPGVMGMEGFAEAASVLAPGFKAIELEGVELLAPFKFYRDEPRAAVLHARLRDGGDGTLLADCELVGHRELHAGESQETRHFTGRVRLARRAPAAPKAAMSPAEVDEAGVTVDHGDVYEVYFHGPAYQVLDRAWRHNGEIVGRLASELPDDHDPADVPMELSPRLIELCFQTAGIWELGTAGRMALPTHVDKVLRFSSAKNPGRLWAVVSPRDGGVDADVVDETGRVRLRLIGYRTIELPGSFEAAALAPIRSAMSGE